MKKTLKASWIVLIAASFFCRTQLANAAIIPPLPNAGYLFDETYSSTTLGSTIKDSFGTSNGLTANGNGTSTTSGASTIVPTTSTDVPFAYVGNASFDVTANTNSTPFRHGSLGVNTYRTLLSGAPAVTFAAWIKYDSANLSANAFGNTIFASTIHSTQGGSGLFINVTSANKISFAGTGASTDTYRDFDSTASLTSGAWNLVVGILDFANDEVKISVNNSAFEVFNTPSPLFGSSALTPGTAGGSNDLIGGRTNTQRYRGLMDEVALWNGALTQENVDWLFNNSVSTLVPEPSVYALTSGLVGLGMIRRRKRTWELNR